MASRKVDQLAGKMDWLTDLTMAAQKDRQMAETKAGMKVAQ